MSYFYIPGYAGHTQGDNGTIMRIVMHGTVSPTVRGGARATGYYFQRPTAGGLAQYVVDPGEIVQCAPDSIATWGAPPNHGAIHVEMCDPETGPASRWQDADHQAMMQLTAGLVRDLCNAHGVPKAYVNASGLLAGQRGITQHMDVSQAWHQTDHSDPIGFPMSQFIQMVVGAPATPPPSTPTPPPVVHVPGVAAPAFPLPGGYYFGPKTGPAQSVSGYYSHRDDLLRWQTQMHNRGWAIGTDGLYGDQTASVTRSFQAEKGLGVDGLIGPATWATAWTAPIS